MGREARNAYKPPDGVQGYNPISKGPVPSARPDNRNYDKPWAVKPKEKKKPETYAEFVYGDGGIGPDSDLINMIERDVLTKNPQVQFDDIADLDETKKLL